MAISCACAMVGTERCSPRRSFTRWKRALKTDFLSAAPAHAVSQSGSQPLVALPCSSASSLVGAFIVAWTDRRLGCQVMTVGKRPFWTHVHSRFCQDAGG